MRAGLDGHEEMTLEQIGQHFGITKERVRQIHVRGMRLLREWAARETVDLP
jgi:DNA-directed RNA polymerase sigma subunit (sigma70/sigma32)